MLYPREFTEKSSEVDYLSPSELEQPSQGVSKLNGKEMKVFSLSPRQLEKAWVLSKETGSGIKELKGQWVPNRDVPFWKGLFEEMKRLNTERGKEKEEIDRLLALRKWFREVAKTTNETQLQDWLSQLEDPTRWLDPETGRATLSEEQIHVLLEEMKRYIAEGKREDRKRQEINRFQALRRFFQTITGTSNLTELSKVEKYLSEGTGDARDWLLDEPEKPPQEKAIGIFEKLQIISPDLLDTYETLLQRSEGENPLSSDEKTTLKNLKKLFQKITGTTDVSEVRSWRRRLEEEHQKNLPSAFLDEEKQEERAATQTDVEIPPLEQLVVERGEEGEEEFDQDESTEPPEEISDIVTDPPLSSPEPALPSTPSSASTSQESNEEFQEIPDGDLEPFALQDGITAEVNHVIPERRFEIPKPLGEKFSPSPAPMLESISDGLREEQRNLQSNKETLGQKNAELKALSSLWFLSKELREKRRLLLEKITDLGRRIATGTSRIASQTIRENIRSGFVEQAAAPRPSSERGRIVSLRQKLESLRQQRDSILPSLRTQRDHVTQEINRIYNEIQGLERGEKRTPTVPLTLAPKQRQILPLNRVPDTFSEKDQQTLVKLKKEWKGVPSWKFWRSEERQDLSLQIEALEKKRRAFVTQTVSEEVKRAA